MFLIISNMFLIISNMFPTINIMFLMVRERSKTCSPLTCRATTPLPFSSPPALSPGFNSPSPDLSRTR